MILDLAHKFPEVNLTPWGKRWSVDAFALMHNAFKAELRDLYMMANVMQRRKWLLTQDHMTTFYEWWQDFQESVTAVLDVEEDVFYPWLSSKEYRRGVLKESSRMKAYGALRNAIKNITEYREQFLPYLPVGERLDGLLEEIKGCNHMPGYYGTVAAALPDFIEICYERKEKDAAMKQIVAALRGLDGYNRNLVLLTGWMGDGAQKRWTMKNLHPGDTLAFGSWKRPIVREHCSLPSRFDDYITQEEDNVDQPVIGAAMAVNEEMRDKLDKSRTSMRNLPTSALS